MTKHSISILTLGLSVGAFALTHALEADAHDQHRIVGDFASPAALAWVHNQARSSFAVWTTYGSDPGGLARCAIPTGDWANCWMYWQPEPAGGWLRVWPTLGCELRGPRLDQ